MTNKRNDKNAKRLEFCRKRLRIHGTPAEAKLWSILKNRQIEGLKFRRQYSIGNYILDFYCPELKLAIELDGEYHYNYQNHQRDIERTDYLYEIAGIKTLRFENHIVFDNPRHIIDYIIFEKQNRYVRF